MFGLRISATHYSRCTAYVGQVRFDATSYVHTDAHGEDDITSAHGDGR